MRLIEALKIYNRNPALWVVPRKGHPQHDELLTILGKHEQVKKNKEARAKKYIQDVETDIVKKTRRKKALENLEHNLGVIVKVNKIRKFLSL
jgi:hypothetical protein